MNDFNLLRKNIHWPSISSTFWIFLASATLAISIFAISSIILGTLKQKSHIEQNTLHRIQQAQNDTIIEIQRINDFIDEYNWLVLKGFIGDEDRLNRVETIQHIKDSRNLPELGYIFNPTEKIATYHGQEADNMHISSTSNLISFILHDETDLDLLFKQLEEKTKGIYTVENCTIKRHIDERHISTSGNIYGDCKLSWLSLKNVDANSHHDNTHQ